MRHRLLLSLCSAWERPEACAPFQRARYPAACLHPFLQAGLVQDAGLATTCGCLDCAGLPHGGCVAEAVAPDSHGHPQYLVSCPREGLFVVPEADLQCWRPSTGQAVARYLAAQLGCRGQLEERVAGHLWRLGHAALGDYLLPCYLALGGRDVQVSERIRRDAGLLGHEPALLFVPAQALPGVGPPVHVRALQDYLEVTDDGVALNLPALYAGLRVLPALTPRVAQPLRVPVGTTWAEVSLTVVTPYCLTIQVAGQTETRSYDALGFANRKRPLAPAEQEAFGARYAWNDCWEHLLRLAAADGDITIADWGRGAARNTVAGWRREITAQLREALGLREGEFMYYSRKEGCYRTNARLTMAAACRKAMRAELGGHR